MFNERLKFLSLMSTMFNERLEFHQLKIILIQLLAATPLEVQMST